MTMTMKAKSPIDMIAFASVAMGFTPTESVVMLTFGSVQFHARLDIPSTDPDDVRASTQALLDPCQQHGVDNVAFLIVTEDEDQAESAWDSLRFAFMASGINVIDALQVTNGRWTRMWNRSETGDADITAHPFIVRAAVEAGSVIRPNRDALRDLVAERDTLDASWLPRALPGDATDEVIREERVSLQCAIDAYLSAGSFPSATLGTVLVGINDGRLRDTVLYALSRRQDGRAHLSLWADTCARAPREYRANAASIFAFASYMAGDGAGAWVGVDAARAVDPDNSLAQIVAAFLENAISPEKAAAIIVD